MTPDEKVTWRAVHGEDPTLRLRRRDGRLRPRPLVANLLAVVAFLSHAAAETQSGETQFKSSGEEEYRFDTGTLRGTLRRGGKSLGLSSIVHVPTGTRLDGGRNGIFSHYRVFTANKRYGHGAWDWPSTSKILPDGSVQIHWPAAKDHPFELRAVYRWSRTNTLDLETTVTARSDLPQFESFLASYFHRAFSGSSVYVGKPTKAGSKPGFATTERSFGHWQLFPRNREVISLVKDGRWQKAPSPVDWAIRQDNAAPLAMRRDQKSGLCAILMASPDDCFAVATPYQGEGHFSLYFSLFGRTLKTGQSATARARLVIALSPTDEQILETYRSYVKELRTREKTSTWPFFAFCMDTHDAKKRTLPQQAAVLEELGYAGCGHLWLDRVEARSKTLSDAGLRLFQVYLRVNLTKPQPLDETRLLKVLPALKRHKTQLALLFPGGKPSDPGLDGKAVAVIKRVADLAKPHGVTVVLYPHQKYWLETCGDAVRLARKVDRPKEVGAMFNLCHWMLADANRDLRAVVRQARPWLMAVSLSGSDTPKQVRARRGKFIQPLGKGTYDITEVLGMLRELEYPGPVGLQCWGIGGDARTHLAQSMRAWKDVTRE